MGSAMDTHQLWPCWPCGPGNRGNHWCEWRGHTPGVTAMNVLSSYKMGRCISRGHASRVNDTCQSRSKSQRVGMGHDGLSCRISACAYNIWPDVVNVQACVGQKARGARVGFGMCLGLCPETSTSTWMNLCDELVQGHCWVCRILPFCFSCFRCCWWLLVGWCGMMWDGGGDGSSIAFVVQHIWPSKSSPCDMSDMWQHELRKPRTWRPVACLHLSLCVLQASFANDTFLSKALRFGFGSLKSWNPYLANPCLSRLIPFQELCSPRCGSCHKACALLATQAFVTLAPIIISLGP